jgi:hypothetical protein
LGLNKCVNILIGIKKNVILTILIII